MIISSLIGGLGNQMFQYAAGFVAAKHANTELKIDNLYYRDKSKRMHQYCYRPYALDHFNLHCQLATPSEIRHFTYPRNINKYIYHILRHFHHEKNVFTEDQIRDYNDLSSLPTYCYLKGFFQKFDFFQYDLEDIKKEFTFKDELPQAHQSIIKEIKNTQDPICIVFRRGDYVGHPTLDIIQLDYYYKALRVLEEKIFVFSDDIPWCRNHFA